MALNATALENAMFGATGFAEHPAPAGSPGWPGRLLFRALARGIVAALSGIAQVTTQDAGNQATGPATGVGAGLQSLNPSRMSADLQGRLGWSGSHTAAMAQGVAQGFTGHAGAAVEIDTVHQQVGLGTGVVSPGGLQANAGLLASEMLSAFQGEFGWSAPSHGVQLIQAVADAVAAELALATGQVTISGPNNPTQPASGQGAGTIR